MKPFNSIHASLFIVAMIIGISATGQEPHNDSLRIEHLNYSTRSEKQVSIRVGLGLQKSFYTELGLALHKCNYSDVGFFSNDIYSALEWTPNKERSVYGVKVGYEANFYLLNLGFEMKYQTNFNENDVVITPKLGLGLFGDINLFYGYNISLNNNPFSEIISRHQVSIVFNFNNHFLSYR